MIERSAGARLEGMTLLVPLLAAAAMSLSLESVRGHVERGELDEALLLLEGKAFTEPERPEAARLMAEAARLALRSDDFLVALHLAQMAQRNNENEPLAAEIAARASFAQEQFDAAERYSERWLEISGRAPEARLLAAELAITQAEWKQVLDLTDGLRASQFDPARGIRLGEIRQQAQQELHQLRVGRSRTKAIEAQLQQRSDRRRSVPTSKAHFSPEAQKLKVRRSCGR